MKSLVKDIKVFIIENILHESKTLQLNLTHLGCKLSGSSISFEDAESKLSIYKPQLIFVNRKAIGNRSVIEVESIFLKNRCAVIWIPNSTEEYIELQNDERIIITLENEQREIKSAIEMSLLNYNKSIEIERLSNELYDTTKMFDSIVKLSRDGIFFLDSDMKISIWSNACEQIFIYSADEAIGKKLSDLVIPENYLETFNDTFENLNAGMSGKIFERVLNFYALKKGGATFPCEFKLSVTKVKGDWKVCGYARDISERVNYEKDLTNLIEELQIAKEKTELHSKDLMGLNEMLKVSEKNLIELNESKDRFFSIISHDLKGPFQGLLGYSDILANDLKNLELEEIHEISINLNDSAQNLYKLLEDLLHWARLQKGAVDFLPENFNLKLLCKANIDLIKPRTQQKNINLINNVDEDFWAYGDRNMINTIIRNLLSNAVKFTNPGESIGLKVIEEKEFMKVCVYDTGVGMTQEVMDKLFKVGTKITTLGTQNEKGTGLGLILCKELVEKNGGHIWVESEIGKGSNFFFTLPKLNTSIVEEE